MSDDKPIPSQEDLQKYLRDLPLDLLGRLPDSEHKERADAHIRLGYAEAAAAREKRQDR